MGDFPLRGPPRKSPRIETGLGEFFFRQAEKFKDRIFQIDGQLDKQESYGTVKTRSTRVAVYLQKIGIKPNDVVLLCCKNDLDNVVPVMATLYVGAKVTSVDPRQSVSDVEHALRLVKPKALFVEKNSVNLVEKALEESNLKPSVLVIGDTSGKHPNMYNIEKEGVRENEFRPVKVNPADTAFILFSSGSTSVPKGICMSHWATLSIAQMLIEHNHLNPGVSMHLSSFYWISAPVLTAIAIVTGTSKLVAPYLNDGEELLKMIENYKITYLFTSCTLTYKITDLDEAVARKYDTSSLYSMCIAGSTVDPNQVVRLRRYLPHTNVNLGYGSTEMNYATVHNYSDKQRSLEKLTSSGTPLPGVQVKVLDRETGKALGPNQTGTIRVKTDYGMVGYHEYTRSDLFDENGFFKMDDIGYYDEDGYIYITDRVSDVFKYKLVHISPSLIEQILAQHPVVKEAIVFGVPHPVDMNHPAACVVLQSGTTVDPDELVSFVDSKVSNAFRLRGGVMIVDSIPKTVTGKYQRRTMRDEFVKARSGK